LGGGGGGGVGGWGVPDLLNGTPASEVQYTKLRLIQRGIANNSEKR